MIKLRAKQNFTYKDFDKIIEIQRKKLDEKGKVNKDDILVVDETMAEYLLGKNPINKAVCEVVEENSISGEADALEEALKDDKAVEQVADEIINKTKRGRKKKEVK